MKNTVVPKDSRYIPFTQQPACCVPTCIQMVMYRHNIPLLPVEEIGHKLGLVVHPDRAGLFYNVRTSKKRPLAGYGTRIYESKYEPNRAFKRLGIPLEFEIQLITKFDTASQLGAALEKFESEDADVLVCFHHGTLIHDPQQDHGHVCVFDKFCDKQIRIVDPSPDQKKWRTVTVENLYNAMLTHGAKNSAGLWVLRMKG